MIKSAFFVALLGTTLYKPVITASFNYEPIKITVNENFNTQPGLASQGLQTFDSGIIHQGANFYFKPQLNLPTDYMASHIKALMSLIKEKPESCTKDTEKLVVHTNKLIEMLNSLQNRIPGVVEVPLETTNKVSIIQEDNNSEISTSVDVTNEENEKQQLSILDAEPEPVIPTASVLPSLLLSELPPIIEEEIKSEDKVFDEVKSEESLSVLPSLPEISVIPVQEAAVINLEPKPINPELLVIPEAPQLPALALSDLPSVIKEEIKSEDKFINEIKSEESLSVLSPLPEISITPTLETTVMNLEPKPVNPEIFVVPKAPLLSLQDLSPVVEEEIKSEDNGVDEIKSKESLSVIPPLPEISITPVQETAEIDFGLKPSNPDVFIVPEGPQLPPIVLNDLPSIVEEEIKTEGKVVEKSKFKESLSLFPLLPEISIPPIQETTVIDLEPKLLNPELAVVPEPPVLPPLSQNVLLPVIQEEVKTDEKVVDEVKSEETLNMLPLIPAISITPVQETTVVDLMPKPINSAFLVVPAASVIPPLILNDLPPVVEEVIKSEDQIVDKVKSEESLSVLRPFPEISITPAQETAEIDFEPNPLNPHVLIVPEAPQLPPLVVKKLPAVVEEDIKSEDQVINDVKSEESLSVLSPLPEISITPPQETAVIKLEAETINPEIFMVPETPVLPPLSEYDYFPVVKEEIKSEDKVVNEIKSEESLSILPPFPQISITHVEDIAAINLEPKPLNSELLVIPEAPQLPPLTLSDLPPNVEEEIKTEDKVVDESKFGEYLSVLPLPSVIDILPIQESTMIGLKPKPLNPEYTVVPEPPVLPPLSLVLPPVIREEFKTEENVVDEVKSEETLNVLPLIPEIFITPVQETTVVDLMPKPINSNFLIVPDTPVLPPLTFNYLPPVVEEIKSEDQVVDEIKSEESLSVLRPFPEISITPIQETTAIDFKPKPINPDFFILPAIPALPMLSLHNLPQVDEEVIKSEENIVDEVKSKESIDVLPTVLEPYARPIQVITVIDAMPNPELAMIPETPILSSSFNSSPQTIEEIKLQEPMTWEEPTNVFSLNHETFVRPIMEPIILPEGSNLQTFTLADHISTVAEVVSENVKIQAPIFTGESIAMFPPSTHIFSEAIVKPEITKPFALERVPQPNPCIECIITAKENAPNAINLKPVKAAKFFRYAPFVTRRYSNPPNDKTKEYMFPKLNTLNLFLQKIRPFNFPIITPPTMALNHWKIPKLVDKKIFLPSASNVHTHNFAANGFAPKMTIKKKIPKRVKIIRSKLPKRPSSVK